MRVGEFDRQGSFGISLRVLQTNMLEAMDIDSKPSLRNRDAHFSLFPRSAWKDQAAGLPARASSSETSVLNASRFGIALIVTMCKLSSNETNCVSPID